MHSVFWGAIIKSAKVLRVKAGGTAESFFRVRSCKILRCRNECNG